MTTSIDTNVLIALWDHHDTFHKQVQKTLDEISESSQMVITGVVYAELLASPGRDEDFIDYFLRRTGIRVDWHIGEEVLRMAGLGFRAYSARRKRGHADQPRRILADFIIGAHAESNGHTLLTLDQRLYKPSFPDLRVLTV